MGNLVYISTFSSVSEYEEASSILKKHDIKSYREDELTYSSCVQSVDKRVKLFVLDEQVQQTKEILIEHGYSIKNRFSFSHLIAIFEKKKK